MAPEHAATGHSNDECRSMRRKSSAPVEDKAAKEAAKNKMFTALSRKTGLTSKEVSLRFPNLFLCSVYCTI